MHQFEDSRIVRRHAAATVIAKPIEFSGAALDHCEVCAVCYQQVIFLLVEYVHQQRAFLA